MVKTRISTVATQTGVQKTMKLLSCIVTTCNVSFQSTQSCKEKFNPLSNLSISTLTCHHLLSKTNQSHSNDVHEHKESFL